MKTIEELHQELNDFLEVKKLFTLSMKENKLLTVYMELFTGLYTPPNKVVRILKVNKIFAGYKSVNAIVYGEYVDGILNTFENPKEMTLNTSRIKKEHITIFEE